MKKIIALLLVIALTATISISGTMAYLQSEDGDVNVMTLGNVKIQQHEYQRAEENGVYTTKTIDGVNSYVLEAFEQAKPLYPATESTNNGAGPWDDTIVRMTQVDSYGSMQVFTSENAQDKFVTVENTGKSDAYVRTLVAVECGSTDGTLVGVSYHSNWGSNPVGIITVDSNNYYLFEYTYKGASDNSRHVNGVLPAGDTTYPNLSQVYLKSEATNEDCEAIDGNGNGMLDVLVLSQAVQAQGFADAQTALNTAFGKANEKAAEWFGNLKANPFAIVTTLSASDTLTNADGDVTVVGEGLKIDTTNSKMGFDVGEIPMDVLYQFEPMMSEEEGAESEYADWHADFVVSVNKDVPAYGIGLAGYYDAWCSLNNDKWVMLASPDPISAGTEIRLVDSMGGGSITVSYEELCNYGNDGIGFLCGAVDMSGKTINGNTAAQIPSGTTLTVELRLYEATGGSRDTETGKYITTGTYTYTFD